MPPKKLPPKAQQQKQQSQSAPKPKNEKPPATTSSKPAIPEQEVKQNSSMSAQLALEAAKKAYDLRQAAYGAGNADAREEILAKAVNKEIEAETFGKAAKYTRSGAFQGLAAGAGLGVQPGVTLGKLTGALVGGLVSSAGALLGGGVGSAYGAISGPFWDLGQMASQGVTSIVGDYLPDWDATPSQKKALEKMAIGTQQTKTPDEKELEQLRDDDGGGSPENYQQFAKDLTSYIPSMPSMPSINMPNMPSMPSMPSMSGFGLGGQSKTETSPSAGNKTATASVSNRSQQPKTAPSPRQEAPAKKPEAPPAKKPEAPPAKKPEAPAKKEAPAKQTAAAKPQSSSAKAASQTPKPQTTQKPDDTAAKKKPKKLESRSTSTNPQPSRSTERKKPPKLEPRRTAPKTAA